MNVLYRCAVLLLCAGGMHAACNSYQNPEYLDDWSFSASEGIPLDHESLRLRIGAIDGFKLTMVSWDATSFEESDVDVDKDEQDQYIMDGQGHFTFTFTQGDETREMNDEQIVSSDFKTFFLASKCDSEVDETKLYLFTKEGKYNRMMKNEIIRSSWRRNWTDEFQVEVEDMVEIEEGANLNTCFNMKPMEGVESHKFDGRWISAKHSEQVPHCVALRPRHSEDIQHVDIGVYVGTTSNLSHTTRAQTLEPGKCSGGNLFDPTMDMTTVHTHLYSDQEYKRWALYHQCATINGEDTDFALVIYKDGAIGKEDLEQQISMVLKTHKWPQGFKKLVKKTKHVAGGNELCTDDALHFWADEFTPEQFTSTYMDAPEPSVPDTWISKWKKN